MDAFAGRITIHKRRRVSVIPYRTAAQTYPDENELTGLLIGRPFRAERGTADDGGCRGIQSPAGGVWGGETSPNNNTTVPSL